MTFTTSRKFVKVSKMSVVPQGVFAARKVRENEKRIKEAEMYNMMPTKYTSKYMDSIWGMYNRYSVHNLKKNMDECMPGFMGQQESAGLKQSPDLKGSLPSARNLFPAPGLL